MWIHLACGHEKKFEVSPEGHCDVYERQPDQDHHVHGHCGFHVVAQHTNTITAPSLCVECFRQVQEDIASSYDNNINELELDYASLFAHLLLETHPRDRKCTERQLEILQEKKDDLKRTRNASVARLWAEQGVWADG